MIIEENKVSHLDKNILNKNNNNHYFLEPEKLKEENKYRYNINNFQPQFLPDFFILNYMIFIILIKFEFI